jgi:NAD+ kinase
MKIHLAIAPNARSLAVAKQLQNFIPPHTPQEADVIAVLGGDGFMLRTLHHLGHLNKPFYGLNCGTVGFLLNDVKPPQALEGATAQAQPTTLYPLLMKAHTPACIHTHHAINEVSLYRQTHQATQICIRINGKVQLESFYGDGLIMSTPAGSTAYNRSAGGPIIPLGAPLLALTPLCPLKPQRWRGALLDDNVLITLTVQEPNNRMVSACADYITIANVHKVEVQRDTSVHYTLLFDPGHNLEERIITEQFM